MVTGRKVLLLESDAAAAFPLASSMRRSGWAIISAADAAQAQQLARQQKPDAVVLNAQLAGGGGLAALKRLRASLHSTLIPVICIVAPGSPEREAFVAAGAQEIIDPPGDPAAINAALSRHLGRGETNHRVPPAVLGARSREEALAASALLETGDPIFDRLTQVTTRLLDVPVALVTVVVADKQIFSGQSGLTEPFASSRSTPLSHSFCQWVVGGNEEVIVSDANRHPVLHTNLAIRDLGVTAYAGVPFGHDQETLGSFCAIDSRPREWTDRELETLRNLSLVLRSYLALQTKAADGDFRRTAVANGVVGATRTLLDNPRAGVAERVALAHLIEEQSHRLVQLVSA